jgi:hypothetical protein
MKLGIVISLRGFVIQKPLVLVRRGQLYVVRLEGTNIGKRKMLAQLA